MQTLQPGALAGETQVETQAVRMCSGVTMNQMLK